MHAQISRSSQLFSYLQYFKERNISAWCSDGLGNISRAQRAVGKTVVLFALSLIKVLFCGKSSKENKVNILADC